MTQPQIRPSRGADGLGGADGPDGAAVPSVLFVCVHNAGRSQMAAAFLTPLAGDRVQVRSAGSEPADAVNPAVVQAMTEAGIDISHEVPKVLTTEAVQASDVVITMGCGDTCPFFPGKRYLDWELPDPAGRASTPSGRSVTRSSSASAACSPSSASPPTHDHASRGARDGWRRRCAPSTPTRSSRSTDSASTRATPRSRRAPRPGRPSTPPTSPSTGSSRSTRAGARDQGGPDAARVLGWVAAVPVSDRCVYAGVVEHSVYVHPAAHGRGVGCALLAALVSSTEAAGIWTIQSGIFPENTASLALHERAGFRRVGVRERLGRHHGTWRDVVLLERRSTVVD